MLKTAAWDGDGRWLKLNVAGDLRCLAGQTLLGEEPRLLVHARPAEFCSY
jgi:hypothetical protein